MSKSKPLNETVRPPRSPDEFNFWRLHADNTEVWDHPLGNKSTFKPEMERATRRADTFNLEKSVEAEDNITAEWVDELLDKIDGLMKGYHFNENEDLDEGLVKKVLDWWTSNNTKEIAKRIEKASLSELVNITKGIPERSARRILSGDKLVEYNHALNRLKEMEKNITEKFEKGKIDFGDETVEITEEDAKVLNSLYDSLNSKNQEKMLKTAMESQEAFDKILSFAKEKV